MRGHNKFSIVLVSLLIIASQIVIIGQTSPIGEKISKVYSIQELLSGWIGAAGSPYIGNASMQPYDINVSNNVGSSMYPSLTLDLLNNPHLAWCDWSHGTPEILYTRWNGAQWVTADGSPYTWAKANVSKNDGYSYNPNLILDNLGNPHLVWFDASYGDEEILYTRWNGTQWVTADGSLYTGTNANVSINTGSSCNPKLSLDSLGNPHLVWDDISCGNHEILYTRWNGAQWVTADGSIYTGTNADVSSNTGSSVYPSVTIDKSDKPHLAWYDDSYSGNHEILYTRWNGNQWVTADGSQYTGENANVSKNNGISAYPILVLDSLDNPHLAWYDKSFKENWEILYTRWNGSQWVTADGSLYARENANVSNTSDDSYKVALSLDSSDNPHIAWTDNSFGNSEIIYTRWEGFQWVTADGSQYAGANANISKNSGLSSSPSLVVDKLSNPHLAWFDNSYGIGSDVIYIHKVTD